VLDAARCSSESGGRVAIEVPRAAVPLSAQLG
jgi:hypothetical protein